MKPKKESCNKASQSYKRNTFSKLSLPAQHFFKIKLNFINKKQNKHIKDLKNSAWYQTPENNFWIWVSSQILNWIVWQKLKVQIRGPYRVQVSGREDARWADVIFCYCNLKLCHMFGNWRRGVAWGNGRADGLLETDSWFSTGVQSKVGLHPAPKATSLNKGPVAFGNPTCKYCILCIIAQYFIYFSPQLVNCKLREGVETPESILGPVNMVANSSFMKKTQPRNLKLPVL